MRKNTVPYPYPVPYFVRHGYGAGFLNNFFVRHGYGTGTVRDLKFIASESGFVAVENEALNNNLGCWSGATKLLGACNKRTR